MPCHCPCPCRCRDSIACFVENRHLICWGREGVLVIVVVVQPSCRLLQCFTFL